MRHDRWYNCSEDASDNEGLEHWIDGVMQSSSITRRCIAGSARRDHRFLVMCTACRGIVNFGSADEGEVTFRRTCLQVESFRQHNLITEGRVNCSCGVEYGEGRRTLKIFCTLMECDVEQKI